MLEEAHPDQADPWPIVAPIWAGALAAVPAGNHLDEVRDRLASAPVAFSAGDDLPRAVSGRRVSYLSWTPVTYPFNPTGQPAAMFPCGFVDGLPVGIQTVG